MNFIMIEAIHFGRFFYPHAQEVFSRTNEYAETKRTINSTSYLSFIILVINRAYHSFIMFSSFRATAFDKSFTTSTRYQSR